MFEKTKDTDNKLKRGGCRRFLVGALALVVVLGGIYSHFGGFYRLNKAERSNAHNFTCAFAKNLAYTQS